MLCTRAESYSCEHSIELQAYMCSMYVSDLCDELTRLPLVQMLHMSEPESVSSYWTGRHASAPLPGY